MLDLADIFVILIYVLTIYLFRYIYLNSYIVSTYITNISAKSNMFTINLIVTPLVRNVPINSED